MVVFGICQEPGLTYLKPWNQKGLFVLEKQGQYHVNKGANYYIPDTSNLHTDFTQRFLEDQEPSFLFIFTGLQQYFLEFAARNATKGKYCMKLVINGTVDDLSQ